MKTPSQTEKKPLNHHLFGKLGNALLVLVISVSFITSVFLARSAFHSPQMAAVISQALISLTNGDRATSELGLLRTNPLLTLAAQAKANDMAQKGYFAHTSPDGTTSWAWFKQVGYNYSYAGENLAVDFSDSTDVENAWLNSPTHRANLLNSHYTEIGIATAVGTFQGHTTTFVVQMFGAPSRSMVPEELPKKVIVPALQVSSLVKVQEPVTAAVAGAATGTQPQLKEKPAMVKTEQNIQAEVPANVLAATNEPTSISYPSEKITLTTVFFNGIASPKSLLHTLYVFFAVFILFALVMQTFVEWRRHHAKHLIVGVLFLVFMTSLLALAEITVFLPPTISPVSASTS